jgi:hypothetical protein
LDKAEFQMRGVVQARFDKELNRSSSEKHEYEDSLNIVIQMSGSLPSPIYRSGALLAKLL